MNFKEYYWRQRKYKWQCFLECIVSDREYPFSGWNLDDVARDSKPRVRFI